MVGIASFHDSKGLDSYLRTFCLDRKEATSMMSTTITARPHRVDELPMPEAFNSMCARFPSGPCACIWCKGERFRVSGTSCSSVRSRSHYWSTGTVLCSSCSLFSPVCALQSSSLLRSAPVQRFQVDCPCSDETTAEGKSSIVVCRVERLDLPTAWNTTGTGTTPRLSNLFKAADFRSSSRLLVTFLRTGICPPKAGHCVFSTHN